VKVRTQRMGRLISTLNYKPNIKDFLNVFWSSGLLKYAFFWPLIFLPLAIISAFFLPMFVIVMLLNTLACSFSIHNYLNAKYDSPAFEGDFKAFTQADIQKQRDAGYTRIYYLRLTLKQTFVLFYIFLALFVLSFFVAF